ncbi:MAG: hypothetical protein K2J01_04950 [Clostridiales bacterium]|nr:hypothetical protein [Clostridiales bacterium]
MAVGQDKIGLSEKDETIGRLYALRAGLSVVAREKETADGIMCDAKNNKKRVMEIAADRVVKEENNLENEQKKLDNIPKKIFDLQKKAKSVGIIPRVILDTIILCIALGGVYLFFVGVAQFILHGIIYEPREALPGLWEPLIGWIDFGWFWILIVAGFISGGGMFALLSLSNEYIYKCSYRERKKARTDIVDLQNSIPIHQNAIAVAKSKVIEQRKQMDRDTLAADKHIAEEKKKATEHAVAGLVMINALEDSFGDLIDPRDWENTDILIYALETRRAENMKEALQVVDGERRTERIVEAVNTAGQEICKSINTGLRRLQSEMTRCFGILGELVVLQGDRIAGHMQSLSNGIAANNSYMAQLTTQQSMSNALLAKANENSSALTAEVSRLRTAAEYAEARSLYGTR